ncbi:hypothetical protein PoB_001638700 [Plakobranchus ocellatus]|uniref:Secreted protein n=1 Tax=Plakobranchus ocellatus TaxID=259542 RepID=A0AAV3Z3Q5_9GAST|nr:hypothetical protein PoB_001638700 [Plakobranchus ocellatus]
MARRRNFRIIFAAVVMATRCCLHRISFRDLIAHPLGRSLASSQHSDQNMQNRFFLFPTQTTHSSGKPTVSRLVRQEECVPRSCTKNLPCVAPEKILQSANSTASPTPTLPDPPKACTKAPQSVKITTLEARPFRAAS